MAASRKTFLRAFEILVVVCVLPFAGGQSLWAQQAPEQGEPQFLITRIEFDGNRRIARDTLTARIFSRPGDPYNEEAVRRDFQALWNTQFFEDIRLEVEDEAPDPGEWENPGVSRAGAADRSPDRIRGEQVDFRVR